MNPIRYFGYWSGQLPPVTELHFRSFVQHHPDAHYDLWLDTDAHSAIAAPSLAWIGAHPRLHLRRFSLDALIEKHVTHAPPAHFNRGQALKKWGRKLHRAGLFGAAELRSFNHPLFGRTYRHSSPLFAGFADNKAYRGDLARCLVPLEHYAQPCLYVDLDLCFMSDLGPMCGEGAFSYRWESFGFANSAVLYLPGPATSRALVARGCELENFLPWILFSDANCAALGLTIHPTELFDPLWTPGSVLAGDAGLFFRANPDPAAVLARLKAEGHRAIHWHNNWHTQPAPSSVYAALLNEARWEPVGLGLGSALPLRAG